MKTFEFFYAAIQPGAVVRWPDLQQGQGHDLGALGFEQELEIADLLAAAGDQRPFAKEGLALEPVELLAQAHHLADDDQGG